MAKILIPIAFYSEEVLGAISDLFSNEANNLFIGLYPVTADSVIGRTGQWKYGLKDYFISEGGDPNQPRMDEMMPEEVKKFEWDAKKYGLKYDVHYMYEQSWSSLKHEGKYGNLLVMTYSKFSSDLGVSNILEDLNLCPILMLSQEAKNIDNIIIPVISEFSIDAIKHLEHLLPDLSMKKLVTIIARSPVTKEEIRNEKYLVEFLRSNFKNVSISWFLSDNLYSELLPLAEDRKNLVVFSRRCANSNDIIRNFIGKNCILNFVLF